MPRNGVAIRISAGSVQSLGAVPLCPGVPARVRVHVPVSYPRLLVVCLQNCEHDGSLAVSERLDTLVIVAYGGSGWRSVSAYYQRRSGRRSARALEDELLLARIRQLHAANYDAYGYRRMWKTLLRAGEQVPRCRVQRLMPAHGIVGAKRRGKPWKTTRPDAQAKRRPDLVQRDFSRSGPNELGWPTSPICAAGKGSSSSRLCSTTTAG